MMVQCCRVDVAIGWSLAVYQDPSAKNIKKNLHQSISISIVKTLAWLWSIVYSKRSAANVTPDRPPPSLQWISTGGFVLWPGGTSLIDADWTELISSKNSVYQMEKCRFLIWKIAYCHRHSKLGLPKKCPTSLGQFCSAHSEYFKCHTDRYRLLCEWYIRSLLVTQRSVTWENSCHTWYYKPKDISILFTF